MNQSINQSINGWSTLTNTAVVATVSRLTPASSCQTYSTVGTIVDTHRHLAVHPNKVRVASASAIVAEAIGVAINRTLSEGTVNPSPSILAHTCVIHTLATRLSEERKEERN